VCLTGPAGGRPPDPDLKLQVLTIAIRNLVLAKRAERADAARDSDNPDHIGATLHIGIQHTSPARSLRMGTESVMRTPSGSGLDQTACRWGVVAAMGRCLRSAIKI
jgi:hypothetical protein